MVFLVTPLLICIPICEIRFELIYCMYTLKTTCSCIIWIFNNYFDWSYHNSRIVLILVYSLVSSGNSGMAKFFTKIIFNSSLIIRVFENSLVFLICFAEYQVSAAVVSWLWSAGFFHLLFSKCMIKQLIILRFIKILLE